MTANVNVTKVLFKRGNTAQNAAYTGINGEVTVDTQAFALRLHDGTTVGGMVVAASEPETYSNANVASYLTAFDGNILPAANITYSLGNEQYQWRDLWVSNNTIYLGNTPIRVDGGTLLIDGSPVGGNPFDQDLNTTDSPNFVNIGLAGIDPPGEDPGYATISIAENKDLYISLSATATGSKVFEFGSDGSLTFPDATVQTTAYTGQENLFDQDLNTTDNVNFGNLALTGGQLTVATDTNFALNLNNSSFGEASVIVDSQGYMTITGGYNGTYFNLIQSGESIGSLAYNGNVAEIYGLNGLTITTDNPEGGPQWQFGYSGNLSTPGDIIVDGGMTISQNSLTGNEGIGLLYLNASSDPDSYIHLDNTGNVDISANSNVKIFTNETLTTNNLYTNPTNFVADIDPSLGFVIDGLSQRNETEIEVNVFVAGGESFQTYLLGLALGRTVVVTYSTGSGNQTYTSTISQAFAGISQFDPATGWARTTGRILGTVPEGYTGLVSINFPVYSAQSHVWRFGSNGDLEAPGNLAVGTAGNLNVMTVKTEFGAIKIGNGGNGTFEVTDPNFTAIMYVAGPDYVITTNGNDTPQSFSFGYLGSADAIFPGNLSLGDGADSEILNPGNNIVVTASSASWTFGTDGNLSLPSGGFVVVSGGIVGTGASPAPYISGFSSANFIGNVSAGNFVTAGNVTAAGNITGNILKIEDGVHEKFQDLADATGTVTHDCSLGHIFYHSSPDANWTVNLTNLNLAPGYATTVTIIIDQGATGYYPNALQIGGGSSMTINWQGNTNPTPSSSRTDVVSFSILALSEGYLLLGQLTGF